MAAVLLASTNSSLAVEAKLFSFTFANSPYTRAYLSFGHECPLAESRNSADAIVTAFDFFSLLDEGTAVQLRKIQIRNTLVAADLWPSRDVDNYLRREIPKSAHVHVLKQTSQGALLAIDMYGHDEDGAVFRYLYRIDDFEIKRLGIELYWPDTGETRPLHNTRFIPSSQRDPLDALAENLRFWCKAKYDPESP